MRYLALARELVFGFFKFGIPAYIVIELLWRDMPQLQSQLLINGISFVGTFFGYLRWRGEGRERTLDVHGSAKFGDERIARSQLDNRTGLIVGRASQGWLLRYDGPAHLLTIAPTRSGKGVGAIVPNLLTCQRSIICVDPKGENARIAARARRAIGPVHVLDPFEVSGQPCAQFNPLTSLTEDSPDLADDAALIADAIVYDPPHQISEAHWNEEAKALIAGLIMHVVARFPPSGRTLARVREILTSAPEVFAAELKRMQAGHDAGGLIARAANRHLSKSEREAAGVLSSAQRHTHFLDSQRMQTSLAQSDFSFADLHSNQATVFLVLPPERLATYSRWLRMLVALSIHDLARSGRAAGARRQVLILLDEFAALGRLDAIERAFGLMAGYGVQLWAILQDLHQLRGLYGHQAGTFLSNAGVTQVFNVADIETARWVSETLGVMTDNYASTSHSESSSATQPFKTHGSSTSVHLVQRQLMTPDEVMRMSASRLLLLRPGMDPLGPWKVRHFADGEFKGLFDP